MASIDKLPSGKWRAQIRRAGVNKSKTFDHKADAETWARTLENQTTHIAASGFTPAPRGATLADLIDKYDEARIAPWGRTKVAALKRLRGDLGHLALADLSHVPIRDFVDQRVKDGAGGVTIAGDLSFLCAVLKWGRHVRRLDLPVEITLDARRDLKYRGLTTRSAERDREPTQAELNKLFAHWAAKPAMQIDMPTLCRFAAASAMRQEEITRLQIEDIDADTKTVVIRDRKDPRRKLGNHQVVPLLPAAWAIVEPILAERKTGALFPYNAKSVSTAFTRACTALKIHDLHFHDLRHKGTADLFRAGLEIPQVALVTGHKTWAMLKRYTALRPQDVHAAYAAKTSGKPPHRPKLKAV